MKDNLLRICLAVRAVDPDLFPKLKEWIVEKKKTMEEDEEYFTDVTREIVDEKESSILITKGIMSEEYLEQVSDKWKPSLKQSFIKEFGGVKKATITIFVGELKYS